jgi:hypothetical protein
MRRAKASASARSAPGATTRLTRPMRCACSAETISAVSNISIVCLGRRYARARPLGSSRTARYRPPVCKTSRRRGRDQLAACSRRDALYGGDDRLRQRGDRLHHRAVGSHDLGEIGPAAVGIGALRRHLLEVMAGTEHGAVCGEDDRPDGAIPGDRGEGLGQGNEQRGRTGCCGAPDG